MEKPIDVVQGNDISEQFTWTEAEPKVEVRGPSLKGVRLKAVNRGNRVALSGKLNSTGSYEVTIVQTRTVKVTINVSQKKSVFQTSVWNVLTGKNEPLGPPPAP